jgi:hypothetical protein
VAADLKLEEWREEWPIEQEVKRLDSAISDVQSRTVAIELSMEQKFAEIRKEWPTPAECRESDTKVQKVAESASTSQTRVKQVAGRESVSQTNVKQVVENESAVRSGDRPKGTVLVVGSSMARGVGGWLESESPMYSKIYSGGAKIEDIEQKLRVIGDKPQSHVVLMVGTNNLIAEGTELIMKRYRGLVKEGLKHQYRRLSIVGILRRKDVGKYIDSKRMGINLRLKKLCDENGIGFIERDVVSDHLGRDGLHLNAVGQEEVGRAIIKHCSQYLN